MSRKVYTQLYGVAKEKVAEEAEKDLLSNWRRHGSSERGQGHSNMVNFA